MPNDARRLGFTARHSSKLAQDSAATASHRDRTLPGIGSEPKPASDIQAARAGRDQYPGHPTVPHHPAGSGRTRPGIKHEAPRSLQRDCHCSLTAELAPSTGWRANRVRAPASGPRWRTVNARCPTYAPRQSPYPVRLDADHTALGAQLANRYGASGSSGPTPSIPRPPIPRSAGQGQRSCLSRPSRQPHCPLGLRDDCRPPPQTCNAPRQANSRLQPNDLRLASPARSTVRRSPVLIVLADVAGSSRNAPTGNRRSAPGLPNARSPPSLRGNSCRCRGKGWCRLQDSNL